MFTTDAEGRAADNKNIHFLALAQDSGDYRGRDQDVLEVVEQEKDAFPGEKGEDGFENLGSGPRLDCQGARQGRGNQARVR
jgi:hypothetical protein